MKRIVKQSLSTLFGMSPTRIGRPLSSEENGETLRVQGQMNPNLFIDLVFLFISLVGHVIFGYCKTLNISVPLMLAKLAMRYHSLTFVDAKINVYRYACAVVCHVVSKAENGVLPVQLVAGKQLSLLLPSCDNPCSTSAGNRSIEQVRAKERRKRGKYNHHDAEVRAKIAKHACEYGNTCSHQ